MQVRRAFSALVIGLGFAAVACDDDDPTAPGQAPLEFGAVLTGTAERPLPALSDATGTASFTVTTGDSDIYDPDSFNIPTVTYSVSVAGLSGTAVSAHIHGPADIQTAAGIIAELEITSTNTTGVIISGNFQGTNDPTISGDSLVTLLRNGLAYVNVHTAAFPDGEIRGQIIEINAFRVVKR